MATIVETNHLPVLDVHCHPFLDRGAVSTEEFVDLTAFGCGSRQYMEEGGIVWSPSIRDELQTLKRSTVYHTRMMLDLAAYFGCEPRAEAVVEARNAAVTSGYSSYVGDLYGSVGIETLVFDYGYPLPQVDIAATRNELPVEIVPIFRIEPLVVDLLKQELSWDAFRGAYDDAITEALTTGGFRGLKSVIAYRTGLDVSPLSRTPDQGYQALDAIKRGLGGGSMKKLRDHLLCRALELCMEHDVPMQIHTGMGDFEVNLPLCRPAFLMDLLRFPIYRGCRVLLVHTGYPYYQEAAYIANVLPRVYLDLSEGIPFAGAGASRIVAGVLEMCPMNKVCYGSDGYSVPEINFTSAKLGKQAIAHALQALVDDGMVTTSDAQQAAAGILAGNARRLYQLD